MPTTVSISLQPGDEGPYESMHQGGSSWSYLGVLVQGDRISNHLVVLFQTSLDPMYHTFVRHLMVPRVVTTHVWATAALLSRALGCSTANSVDQLIRRNPLAFEGKFIAINLMALKDHVLILLNSRGVLVAPTL